MLFDPHRPVLNRQTNQPINEGVVDLSGLDDAVRAKVIEALRGIADDLRPVTMGSLAMRALDATYKDENIVADEKYKRFILGTKIAGTKAGDLLDLGIEDAKMIKDVVAKAYAVGAWGQIWAALDEAAKAPVAVAA